MSENKKQAVGTVGWFDLTAENADLVRDFYQAVVGWDYEPVGMGDYNDYSMIPAGAVCALYHP
jgi:predicted enzyme related to lactoylglutathione lyase